MATQDMVSEYEARLSSTHSSPVQVTRDVPLFTSIVQKPKEFVLTNEFLDKHGVPKEKDSVVKGNLMSYVQDISDEVSKDIKWSEYKYLGDDTRLSGKYFLYAIRGQKPHCRHMNLLPKYRLKWMAAGTQSLKLIQYADEEVDEVVSFRMTELGENAQESLSSTMAAMRKTLSRRTSNQLRDKWRWIASGRHFRMLVIAT